MHRMPSERRLHVRELLPYALGVCVLVISLSLRVSWYPVATSDYIYFVKVWFSTLMTHPGLSAFAQPFSDYAPLYLYLLKLLTFIPLDSLFLAKSLSFLFDIAIAALAVLLARDTAPVAYGKSGSFLIFAIFLSIPTVVMNSSLWGQSDALYAAPVILSLYFILRDRPRSAAASFGFAISMKVQAIFFAPVLIGYLLQRKETRAYIVIPILIFIATVFPAALAGGDPSYWPLVYLKESGEYPYLSVSAPSIFAFVSSMSLPAAVQNILFWAGVTLSALAALAVAYLSKARLRPERVLVLLSLASVLVIPYLLPRMHERYFYLADIISFLYVLYDPRRWYLAVMVVAASALAYMPFLSSQVAFLSSFNVDLRIPAAILLVAACIVLLNLFYSVRSSLRRGTAVQQ
jgi:Gpi18-like mannosyltransferase